MGWEISGVNNQIMNINTTKTVGVTMDHSCPGILENIFEGILANIKIKLRYVRCLLPAKITVDFSTVESQIAIAYFV